MPVVQAAGPLFVAYARRSQPRAFCTSVLYSALVADEGDPSLVRYARGVGQHSRPGQSSLLWSVRIVSTRPTLWSAVVVSQLVPVSPLPSPSMRPAPVLVSVSIRAVCWEYTGAESA